MRTCVLMKSRNAPAALSTSRFPSAWTDMRTALAELGPEFVSEFGSPDFLPRRSGPLVILGWWLWVLRRFLPWGPSRLLRLVCPSLAWLVCPYHILPLLNVDICI